MLVYSRDSTTTFQYFHTEDGFMLSHSVLDSPWALAVSSLLFFLVSISIILLKGCC